MVKSVETFEKFSPSWSPPPPLLLSSWSPPPLLLVSSSPPPPLLLVSSWSPPPLLLVSSWSPPGLLLLSSWSPPLLLLFSSFSPPGLSGAPHQVINPEPYLREGGGEGAVFLLSACLWFLFEIGGLVVLVFHGCVC